MVDQLKFIAALGATFPILSDTMLVKCWREVQGLPQASLEALYAGLLHGGIAAMDARRSTAKAITDSIGKEARR